MIRKIFGRKNTQSTPAQASYRTQAGSLHEFFKLIAGRGRAWTTIMDVGANKSNWSREAAAFFPEAKFIMIEPQEEMRVHLEKFCSDFPGSSYHLCGAGAVEGDFTLTVWDDLAGSSFLPEQQPQLSNTGKQRSVPVHTIDNLIAQSGNEIPQLIKLDIQGFELEALKGANNTFGKTEVYIVETSFFNFINGTPLFYDVVHFMKQRGYSVYDFAGFVRRPFDRALGQCDICFVKDNGIFRTSNRWS